MSWTWRACCCSGVVEAVTATSSCRVRLVFLSWLANLVSSWKHEVRQHLLVDGCADFGRHPKPSQKPDIRLQTPGSCVSDFLQDLRFQIKCKTCFSEKRNLAPRGSAQSRSTVVPTVVFACSQLDQKLHGVYAVPTVNDSNLKYF